jgi:hypothetical protein
MAACAGQVLSSWETVSANLRDLLRGARRSRTVERERELRLQREERELLDAEMEYHLAEAELDRRYRALAEEGLLTPEEMRGGMSGMSCIGDYAETPPPDKRRRADTPEAAAAAAAAAGKGKARRIAP